MMTHLLMSVGRLQQLPIVCCPGLFSEAASMCSPSRWCLLQVTLWLCHHIIVV